MFHISHYINGTCNIYFAVRHVVLYQNGHVVGSTSLPTHQNPAKNA
jgi:hypothetical protein